MSDLSPTLPAADALAAVADAATELRATLDEELQFFFRLLDAAGGLLAGNIEYGHTPTDDHGERIGPDEFHFIDADMIVEVGEHTVCINRRGGKIRVQVLQTEWHGGRSLVASRWRLARQLVDLHDIVAAAEVRLSRAAKSQLAALLASYA